MYSKEKAASVVKRDVKYIPAGIHENVTLKSVKTEVSPNGGHFLEMIFEKDGATMIHTEWEPKLGGYTDTPEKLQDKETNQYSRMLQILTCFYDESQIDFNGSSFSEFSSYIVNMLNAANKDKKLRVKVVYNKNGYTTLPNYAKYTFIEPMELPEGKTSAIVQLSIDTFIKPVVADIEKENSNPFKKQETVSDNTPASDLPF